MRRLGSGSDVLRPPGNRGNTNAAVRETAFDAGIGPARIESLQTMMTFIVRAIVTGKDDERVLRDAQFLKFVEQSTDMPVQPRDHRRMSFWR